MRPRGYRRNFRSGFGAHRFGRQLKNLKAIGSMMLAVSPVAAMLTSAHSARGATDTWSGLGSDNFWLDSSNWNTLPAAGDVLDFAGTLNLLASNNYTPLTTFDGITFASGADAFTLSGNTITFGGLTTFTTVGTLSSSGVLVNSSTATQIVSLGLVLSNNNHLFQSSASATSILDLDGAITAYAPSPASPVVVGGVAQFFQGPTGGGIFVNTAANPLTNGILGGWATFDGTNANITTASAGVPTDWATYNSATGQIVGLSSIAGGYTQIGTTATALTDGTNVTSASNVQIITGSGAVSAAAGTTYINTIYSSDTAVRTITIGAGNTLVLGPTGGILQSVSDANTLFISGGTLTAGGPLSGTPGEINIIPTEVGTNGGIDITSIIANNGTGAVSVIKSGTGVSVLGGANTFSGGLYIDQGRVEATNASSFGTGSVYVQPGAYAYIDVNPIANNFFIAGVGDYDEEFGAIRLSGDTISGTVTLVGNARIDARAATGTISGPVMGNYILDVGDAASASASTGTLVLTNSNNSWSGGLEISYGTVRPTVTGAIPRGEDVDLTGAGGTGDLSVLDLDGASQTIGVLYSGSNWSNTGTPSTVNQTVTNTSSNTATLTLGADNGTGTYGGAIVNGNGGIGIIKIGTGTQTFSGTDTYALGTTVNAGDMVAGSVSAFGTGPMTVNGGQLDLHGFSESFGAFGGTGGVITNSAATGTATLTVSGGTGSFAGSIQNGPSASVALDITGGSTTLTGSSNFGGGATVGSSAVLTVNGTLAAANPVNVSGSLGGVGALGNVSLASGAYIHPGSTAATGTVGTMSLANLNINGGSNLAFDILSPTNYGQLNVSGTASLIGGSATIDPTFDAIALPGTYALVTSSGLNLNGNSFSLGGSLEPNTRATETLTTTSTAVDLIVTGSPANLFWSNANGNGDWDVVTTSNWFNSGTSNADLFYNADSVTFDDTHNGGTAYTVNLTTTVAPGSITVNNSANNYTFTGGGSIAGAPNLTKTGSDDLILSNSGGNSFNNINVQSGAVIVAASNALNASGTLTLGNGGSSGVLDLGGNPVSVDGLATSGTGGSDVVGNSGSSGATLTVAGTSTTTFAGAIVDNNPLGLGGSQTALNVASGKLILTGSNTFSGAASIGSAGTLQIGNGAASGSLNPAATINDNGTLAFGRTDSITVPSYISGNGNLSVNSGTVALMNSNNYSGTTTIASGAALQIDAGGTVGLLGTGPVSNSGTLIFDRADTLSLQSSNTISGNGTVVYGGGPNTSITINATSTYTGTTYINDGTVTTATGAGPFGSGGAVIIANGAAFNFGTVTAEAENFGSQTFEIAGTGISNTGVIVNTANPQEDAIANVMLLGNATINTAARIDLGREGGPNVLNLNGFTLTKIGGAQLSITTGNVHIEGPGGIDVTSGLLSIESNTTSDATVTIQYQDGSTAGFYATASALNNAIVIGNGQTGQGTLGVQMGNDDTTATISTVGGPILLEDNLTLGLSSANSSTLALTGVISDTGTPSNPSPYSVSVQAGTAVLAGANTYTGGSSVDGGTLQIGNASALGTGGVNVTSGALDLHGFNLALAGLIGNGGVVTNNGSGTSTLTVSGIGATTPSYSGVIQNGSGAVALVINGSGTQNLSGNNTYTGGTTITSGTLQAGGGNTIVGTGPLAINGGAFDLNGNNPTIFALLGTGTITDTSSNGATLNLGIASGSSTFGGTIVNGSGQVAVTMVGGGTQVLAGNESYSGDTNINSGTLAVTGSLTATGNININSSTASLLVTGTTNRSGNVNVNEGLLQGTGTVGNVSVNGGGFVNAGTAAATIADLTMTGVSVNNAGVLDFDLSGTTHDELLVTGTANFSGGSDIQLIDDSSITAGTYTILVANSLNAGQGGNAGGSEPTLLSPAGRQVFSLDFSHSNEIMIDVGAPNASATLVWVGNANNGTWDTQTTRNWNDLTYPGDNTPTDVFFAGDSVNFTDTAQSFAVNINGTVAPGSITVNNSVNNYTFNGGAITGAGGLTKMGTASLLLNSNSSYTGTTAVQNGTLELGNSNALPVGGNVTLGDASNDSGVLDLNGQSVTLGGLSTVGSGANNVVGSSSGGATINFQGGATPSVFGGAIVDNYKGGGSQLSLNMLSGSLVLAGSNTYSGNTSIGSAAALQVGNGTTGSINANSSITDNGILTFDTPTTLTIGNQIQGNGTLTQNGAGTLILLQASTNLTAVNIGVGSALQLDNGGTNGAISGTITDNGTLIYDRSDTPTISTPIQGAGSVVYNGGTATNYTINTVSTYSGNTFINDGQVTEGVAGAIFGNASGTVTIANGAGLNIGPAVASNGANFGSQLFVIAGAGPVVNGTAVGAIENTSGNEQEDAIAHLSLAGDATVNTPSRLDFGREGTGNFIDLNGYTLTKIGAGQLSVTTNGVAITGPGAIDITQGELSIEETCTSTANVTITYLDGTTAGFYENTGLLANAIVIGNGQADQGTAGVLLGNDDANVTTSTIGGPIELEDNLIIGGGSLGSATDTTVLSGSISDNGTPYTLSVTSQTLVLSGTNTYTGQTIIAGGALTVGSGGASGSLGTGAVTDDNSLSFNRSDTGLVVANAITGNGTVLQIGTGTTTLTSASNAYTGGTILDAGALAIPADNVIPGGVAGITFNGGALQFNNYASNYSFSGIANLKLGAGTGTPATLDGSITGASQLTYVGPGTLVLATANSYSGGTILNAGELSIASLSEIGGASSGIDFNGGILGVTGTAITNLNSNSVNWSTFNGGFDIGAAANTFSVSSNIGGTGSLTKLGSGTLVLSGSNSYSGGTSVVSGLLAASAANSLPAGGSLSVGTATSNAKAQLTTVRGGFTLGGLTVASGSTLDVESNEVLISYGAADPVASIASYLTDGYNAGWAAGEISSSAVASFNASQSKLVYDVGYADGGDGSNITSVPSGEIEILPTLAGDAKLQGNVVFGDFQILAQYFGKSGTSWDEGDFRYSGTTNFGDFQALAQDFGSSNGGLTSGEIASLNSFAAQFGDALVANPGGGFSVVAVPEPASLGLVAAAGLGLLARRRRRK